MSARYTRGIIILIGLTTLLPLARASSMYTAYLPIICRMPPPGPSLFGIVFFDYNGSGLQEQGEPGIANVTLQLQLADADVAPVMTNSGADGDYTFANLQPGARYMLLVTSPTDDPATGYRYINILRGPITVPQYTQDIDAAVMATLAVVPACNDPGNPNVLVCKQDADTLLVREQHLMDSEMRSIDQPLMYTIDANRVNDIALMQGILTMPILQSDWARMSRTQAYDHDPRKDWVADFKGDTTVCEDQAKPFTDCTFDNHLGWDYGVPQGSILISSVYGQNQIKLPHVVFIVPSPETYIDGGNPFLCSYGHLLLTLVADQQKVYRGQVLAVSGKVGTNWDHLHFGAQYGRDPPREPDDDVSSGPIWEKDTYGVLEPIPVRFAIERWGLWTVFNDPQFPLVSLGE